MTQNAAERNEVRDEKALDKIPRDVAREYLHHGAPASFVLALHAMLSNESSRLVHLSPDGDLVRNPPAHVTASHLTAHRLFVTLPNSKIPAS